MKNYIIFLVFLVIVKTTNGQQSSIEIVAPNISQESFIDFQVSDSHQDYLKILNGTVTSNQFIPMIATHHESDDRASLIFMASVGESNDQNNGNPIIAFDSRIKLNNGYGPVINRNLFAWNSHSSAKMVMSSNGYLGIGTSIPKSKLQIKEGDVYIEDPTKGIILTAPDNTCYRITVENGGLLKSTSIICPN